MEKFCNEIDCLLSLVDHVEIRVEDDVNIRNSDSEQTITESDNCFLAIQTVVIFPQEINTLEVIVIFSLIFNALVFA